MNKQKLWLLVITLLLNACSSVSDTRPEPIRKSEYLLESGVSAFENSDFVEATDFLRKALAHYRSIDDREGVLFSHINLAETALAAGNFDAAEAHTAAAQQITRSGEFQGLAPRITLLQAQRQWRRGLRDETLHLLAPLMPQFNEEQRTSIKPNLVTLGATTLQTDIAFAQADNAAQQRLWLKRLSLMAPATEGNTELHQARLLRFEAQLAQTDGALAEALEKFSQALQLYRASASRPAIAATLTEIGGLLMQQQRWKEAEDHLQRALYIRLWIMDRIGSTKLLEMLKQTYQQLGDEERYLQTLKQAQRISQPK